MAKVSQKTLTALSKHIRKQGYHTANHETTSIDGQEIEFSYGVVSGIKIHSTNLVNAGTPPVKAPKAAKPKPQTHAAKPSPAPTKLDTLIKKGDVVVKKGNWYSYKGKNYQGKAKITTAIK